MENNMKTYICFNDESGSWSDKKRDFYIRASLIVDAAQLKKIEEEINQIRENLELSNLNEEIKWQDLWQLRLSFENDKKPKDSRLKNIYNHLKSINQDYHLLIEYCEKVLNILTKQEYNFRIILTFTEKEKCPTHKEKDIYKFHIQDHLQRMQMQYPNSIVLIVYDSIDENTKKMFKDIHKEIITSGDFIKDYKSIFESLLFDDSYDNKLLQMVDFIAGSFAGTLTAIKKKYNNNYQKGIQNFCNSIYPKLCKDEKEEIWGVGIKETPRDENQRKLYKESILNLVNNYNDLPYY